ncbi:hypothetical protein [Tautonia plasticadhaerens]|uniref:Carboxypeptidase regulatory-like domain-containing protein n=1 Tax=Tautonia plasticadhaerens TaxID=2527974 RepID=A0A518H6X7_9BACT|nr:hypothetical protein [Tautonia plasticadhaerens]QDV36534.1 hypothetical protein ElP_44600 [Tautonia plasticadhaerens]
MSTRQIPTAWGNASALFAGAALIVVLGCGDDTGIGKRYSVTGKVTFKGAPLEKGRIDFIPTDLENGRPATGTIQDGIFRLTTLTPGDGALPGDYKVTISALNVDNTAVEKTIMEQGGGGRQHEIAMATQKGKSLVPSKYSLADTSGLTATVEERSNSFTFDLEEF